MISRKYKSAFGELVQPLNLALHRLRVSADHLTLAGIVFGVLAALAFAEGRLPLGGVFLALAGVADMLDGSLARVSGSASPLRLVHRLGGRPRHRRPHPRRPGLALPRDAGAGRRRSPRSAARSS